MTKIKRMTELNKTALKMKERKKICDKKKKKFYSLFQKDQNLLSLNLGSH